MSTRSGKRIHAEENSKKNEDQVPKKSDVMTRSRKLKENDIHVTTTASKLKKRPNYVTYPASDETEAEPTSDELVEEAPEQKKPRKLRRYTLKEKNIVEPVTVTEEVEEIKKSTRITRRNKRVSETTDVPEPNRKSTDLVKNGESTVKKNRNRKPKNDIQEVELHVEKETRIPVPKGKKSKSKKGTKSKKVSLVNEDDHQDEEQSQTNKLPTTFSSIDSFYSAVESLSSPSPEVMQNKKSKATVSSTVKAVRNVVDKESQVNEPPLNVSEGRSKRKRTSYVLQTVSNDMDVDDNCRKTLEFSFKINEEKSAEVNNSTFDKEPATEKTTSKKKLKAKRTSKKSSLLQDSFQKMDVIDTLQKNLDSTYDKNEENLLEVQNSTFDKEPAAIVANTKFEKSEFTSSEIQNSTFDKSPANSSNNTETAVIFSNMTLDKSEQKLSEIQNTTFDKSPAISTTSTDMPTEKLNTTFDKISLDSKTASLNSTYDKEPTQKLDTTFDKPNSNPDSGKSSIVSSDNSNITLDKSNETSRISITSDDSKTENIINTTPMLIESSLDESQINQSSKKISEDLAKMVDKTEDADVNMMPLPPVTPLGLEGTFTRDELDATIMSPKPKPAKSSVDKTPVKTPTRSMSVSSPGSTPFPGARSMSAPRSVLNVTRSIEKSRRSSIAEEVPQQGRQTRVMFCSPVDTTTLGTQQKRKIIKSSLKGSNKSFVFDEDSRSTSTQPGARRKRSFTADAEPSSAKRTRLGGDALPPASGARRARTNSAIVKPVTRTPKAVTPSKPEARVLRTKLPNFAALHRKQFARMESLDECQERKARRAKQLLTPTGNIAVLERSSPRVSTEPPKAKETEKRRETKKSEVAKTEATKTETDSAKPMLPTLESLRPGFTRFGFKMNIGVNPFISPIKSASKPKEIRPNGLKREGTLTSLMSSMSGVKKNKPNESNTQSALPTGSTSSRKESAKQTVLREKSFSHSSKRDETRMENRTIIKGVRTNRRFELQMQMRNIN